VTPPTEIPTGKRAALLALVVLSAAACSSVPVKNPVANTFPAVSIPAGERWDPVSVCGQMFLRAETTVGEGAGPPFQIVVLGDSIVWGQGLPEEQKSSTLVQRSIAEKHNRPVRKRVYAHSGATLEQAGSVLDIAHGEVPSDSPHIALQAECVPNPGEVDLVLVNGCINDVDGARFFDPTTDPESSGIGKLCEEKCGEPMRRLLARIMARFPKARIVLPGYYPFFSGQTPKATLHFVSLLFTVMTNPGGELPPWPDAADRMIRKSAIWYETSNTTLARAVEEADRAEGGTGRVVFAPVPFLPEHAYGAPESMLWAITEHDDVAASRWWECLGREKIADRIRCINASAFHPNPAGAKVYADSIIRALERPRETTTGIPER